MVIEHNCTQRDLCTFLNLYFKFFAVTILYKNYESFFFIMKVTNLLPMSLISPFNSQINLVRTQCALSVQICQICYKYFNHPVRKSDIVAIKESLLIKQQNISVTIIHKAVCIRTSVLHAVLCADHACEF